MQKRTITDIEIEIDDLKLEILDLWKSIHEDEPDWREAHRRKTGDIGPGYVPLAERRERVEVLERQVERLKQERDALLIVQGSPTASKMAHGELKAIVGRLAARDGFKPGDTVPSSRIREWVQEIQKDGKSTTAASIRSQLTNLGITKARTTKGE